MVARWANAGVRDAAVCLGYTWFAFWLTSGLWPDPATRAIAENVNDQALIEWFLAHGVLFWTGDFGLVTERLNSPDGVNLMSNASHILHGVIMAPVTATLGVAVSFALLVALNLAATAAGWYLLLARGLRLHRGAAIIGGAFAGFAPGMISQSNSHLHMTAQWLVPPIVWCVIKLTRVSTGRSTVLTAGALAALVCAQLMLGEEVLFLAALTVGIFALVYALCRRDWARRVGRRFLAGMAAATGISTVVLAYPLAIQFAGDQHTPNAPFGPHFFYADVASYGVFSPLSLAGSDEAGRLATSAAEYNTYLGLPLLLVLLGCAIWLRRSPVIVATVVTGAVMALLSFGPNVTFDGKQTGLPAPYALIADVPVINGALPTRYALALIPLISVALAYAVSAALRGSGFVRSGRAGGRRHGAPADRTEAVSGDRPRPGAVVHQQWCLAAVCAGGGRAGAGAAADAAGSGSHAVAGRRECGVRHPGGFLHRPVWCRVASHRSEPTHGRRPSCWPRLPVRARCRRSLTRRAPRRRPISRSGGRTVWRLPMDPRRLPCGPLWICCWDRVRTSPAPGPGGSPGKCRLLRRRAGSVASCGAEPARFAKPRLTSPDAWSQ